MRYAVHAYAWTSSWSNDDLDLIDHAASLGLDAIEIPLMELHAVDPGAIRDRTERARIDVLTSVVCPEDAEPSSEDERVREAGRDFLMRCVDVTADMGASVFTGVTYLGARPPARPASRAGRHGARRRRAACGCPSRRRPRRPGRD
jgi:D-psicose/D-tagatose/L-ribulose 3-epimerase